MQLIIRGEAALVQEWTKDGVEEGIDLVVINEAAAFAAYPNAEGFIDLSFEEDPHHYLDGVHAVVMVSAVSTTTNSLPSHFIRINGWPTMLSAKIEAAAGTGANLAKASEIVSACKKELVLVPDQPGMITPRVISMIINEAYLALEEGVSSKDEINTAMKLGTNYPYGPFEWAQKIGLSRIQNLIATLEKEKPHYRAGNLIHQ